MSLEARITPTWKKQKGLMAVFFVGFGLWFLFDGYSGFPGSNVRWLAHENLKKENRLAEWPALARKAGWNEEPPHKFYQKRDITGQYVVGLVLLLSGAASFAYWSGQIKRTFKLDDNVVIVPDGKRVPLDCITGVNAKKWDAKGLATIHYTVNGRVGKFVLDDYKFERDPIHAIMTAIGEKLRR